MATQVNYLNKENQNLTNSVCPASQRSSFYDAWYNRTAHLADDSFRPNNKGATPTIIDYRCDNRRFWLSAHNCQVPTPTSQNLELEQQIWIFGAD